MLYFKAMTTCKIMAKFPDSLFPTIVISLKTNTKILESSDNFRNEHWRHWGCTWTLEALIHFTSLLWNLDFPIIFCMKYAIFPVVQVKAHGEQYLLLKCKGNVIWRWENCMAPWYTRHMEMRREKEEVSKYSEVWGKEQSWASKIPLTEISTIPYTQTHLLLGLSLSTNP